jgi:hypothetical protein
VPRWPALERWANAARRTLGDPSLSLIAVAAPPRASSVAPPAIGIASDAHADPARDPAADRSRNVRPTCDAHGMLDGSLATIYIKLWHLSDDAIPPVFALYELAASSGRRRARGTG